MKVEHKQYIINNGIFYKFINIEIFEIIGKHQEVIITTYADDTNLLITQQLYTDLLLSTDICLNMLQNWFVSNKMPSEEGQLIYYCFKIVVTMTHKLMLTLLQNLFQVTDTTKSLGIQLDSNLCCLK